MDNSIVVKKHLIEGAAHPPQDGLDLHTLFDAFQKRKLLIAYSVAAGLLIAVLVCLLMKPQYDAVATLNVHPEGGDSLDLGSISDIASGGSGLDWEAKVQTQVLIITSEPLALDVIRQLRLDQNPAFMHPSLFGVFSSCKMVVTPSGQSFDSIPPCRKYAMLRRFSKDLDVAALPKTQAVEIRFRSTDPAISAKVVNALTAAYLHYNFITRYNATMQASVWLQDRLTGMRKHVEKAEENLAAFQKQANIIGTDETDNLAVNELSDMSKQLTDAKADRILKEANYRMSLTGNPELIGTIVPDSVLPTLRSQQAQLNTLLAGALAEYGARYPKVVQLQSQLAEVNTSLQKETKDIQARFKSQYEAAQNAEEGLTNAMDRLKAEAFSQSTKWDRYVLLKNEVTSTQGLYDDLLKKLNEAGVTAGLKSTNVDVIAPAQIPLRPSLPNVPVFLLVGLAGGFLLGVLLVFVAENLDQSIRGFQEAEEIFSLPVIGLLPHVSGVSSRIATSLTGSEDSYKKILPPASEFSEAVRSLRTALLLAAPGEPSKVIMMTSPLPGEGKSLISLNLAANLARFQRRVILVDTEVRRGKLPRKGKNQASGLSGCLAGATTWRDEIRRIPLDEGELYILPSGFRPSNPAELLGSEQMSSLIEQLRAEFDHIVIDTAPVAIVTDPVILSRLADMILIVARVNCTTRFALEQAHSTISRVSGRIAGVILNDDNVAKRYYGYRSYHHYYSYYTDNGNGASRSASGLSLKSMD